MPKYVSVRLTDGLGNRLFQVAALLGYAEKHNLRPVFLREQICANSHSNTELVPFLFPTIPVLPQEGEWFEWSAGPEDAFTFVTIPEFTEGQAILRGYFQCERYFPSVLPTIVAPRAVAPGGADSVFLHIRRGDYLNPYCAHHRVELMDYYRRAFALFGSAVYVVVCSDDMAWCKEELPREFPEVRGDRWIWMEGSEVETLGAMAGCTRGGICANSTFSWWGAWLGHRASADRLYCFPDTWGYPPLPPARDIWPAWGLKISVAPSVKN